jgi:hypothetical protein
MEICKVLYIANSMNHVIRTINGSVSTFTCTNEPGFDNGPLLNVKFQFPTRLGFDSKGN